MRSFRAASLTVARRCPIWQAMRWRTARRAGAGVLCLVGGAALAAGASTLDLGSRADLVHHLEPAQVAGSGGSEAWAWPELAPACLEPPHCSLFLEVDVRQSRSAPRIEVRAQGEQEVVFEQWLMPQRRGAAWLEVSALSMLRAGTKVELETRSLRLDVAARRRLVGFFNPLIEEATRVLVIAPHPDDAEIAAFGLYANTDADVVTVTAGDAGGFNYRALISEPSAHYRLKGEMRTWDSITVPRLGGVSPRRARNLGYYDATLATLWRVRPEAVAPVLAPLENPAVYRQLNVDEIVRQRPMEPTWRSLVADLAAELERVEPQLVVAPHPFLDAHGDHQFTTVALIEALEGLASAPQTSAAQTSAAPLLLLYTNHMVGAEPWPWGPRGAVVGPPPLDAVSEATQLEFDALLSWPLSASDVALKILALEMMHDLRPLDLQQPRRARTLWKEAARATARAWRRPQPSFSYLRRAPRPNELFFVLQPDAASALKQRFLHNQPKP